jgi:hypothetical protein
LKVILVFGLILTLNPFRLTLSLSLLLGSVVLGFVTGISIGFVGTAFPLLIPMFPTNPP